MRRGHLIDFNGRFVGSMALTVARGVDLPAARPSAAYDEPLHIATPVGPARHLALRVTRQAG